MKRLLVLIVLLALLIPSAAFAVVVERPPEPVCDEGMVTVEEAEWVERVPGYWVYGSWGKAHNGKCPPKQLARSTCKQWRRGRWRHRHRSRIRVKAIPGYWIYPICRAPVPGCTDRAALNFVLGAEVDDGSCAYPEPVCPLQLLRNYNPPEGWLPYCMVLTEGGVSVERQPAICGWIADNHPCGGMVYDDGTEYGQWACDRYGYYRQPISVLKCLWQRHLNGQRDPESFAKCHGVEAPILDLDRMDDK